LKSIVIASKNSFQMRKPLESFNMPPKRKAPYIEPTFAKNQFDVEKPAIILISAVGATGKSTLANVLSNDTGLPLLDLSKHKPVADNTLTGLLTSTFDYKDLSTIFTSIGDGTFGIIIDGIDEGRSKTTEKAFEAFLDDIVKLCENPANTSFVLLGRTRILEDCWLYFAEKGVSTGLITISSFDLEEARKYIDAFTGPRNPNFEKQYIEVRDLILITLGAAFGDSDSNREKNFLSFIGYAPVLDAIVTLLNEEHNYHRLKQEMHDPNSINVEINLLYRIASYILRREKEQKVIPNILNPLMAGMPDEIQGNFIKAAFEEDEQCMRLVSYCLDRPLKLQRLSNNSINEKYEEQLSSWLHEHPFLDGRKFRNAVFESVALSVLITSTDPLNEELILEYVASHKHSYHLIYLLNLIATNGFVPIKYLHIILSSAIEFISTNTYVELHVDGPEIINSTSYADSVEIQIEIFLGEEKNRSKLFAFKSNLEAVESVNLGHHLLSAYVDLSCDVILSGSREIELTAPVEITAKSITIQSELLIIKPAPKSSVNKSVLMAAMEIKSSLENIASNSIPLVFAVPPHHGLSFPIIQYVKNQGALPPDPQLKEKYIRLKRILTAFRSHSRGSLARFKHKIEDDRILRNDMGRAILQRLIKDGIITLAGDFYYLLPDGIAKHLGISWTDLKNYQTSDALLQYLRSIK
jgi:hypothetical protein